MKVEGTVVAAFGRHYEILLSDGNHITGFPLGKKSPYACGDHVRLETSASGQGQILGHTPRKTLLYRSDNFRQKLIAANPTQIVLVVATEPGFSEELLTRALVAAASQSLRVVIVLNKTDISGRLPEARLQLSAYTTLGYPIVELCAKADVSSLRPYLVGQLSILVGQSGMGKSTLINALLPEAAAATREISSALDSGKHTTTYARLYPLDAESAIIDSPGLQEFGLAHLSRGEIEQGFIEFRPYLEHCRFRDCHHDAEPDCAIKQAVLDGLVSARRYALFQRITNAAC